MYAAGAGISAFVWSMRAFRKLIGRGYRCESEGGSGKFVCRSRERDLR